METNTKRFSVEEEKFEETCVSNCKYFFVSFLYTESESVCACVCAE